MQHLFSIQSIAFEWHGYRMSWLELSGATTGLWSVWLLSRERVWGFPIGILSVIILAVLFYQLALYADMFLQGYFLVTCFYGWYAWLHPHAEQTNQDNQLRVQTLSRSTWLWLIPSIFLTAQLLSYIVGHLHTWFPDYFITPAAWPYTNSLMMAISLAAEWILARKYIENWYLWLVTDIIATYIYFQQGIFLLSMEYFIFMLLSVQGIITWRKTLISSQSPHLTANKFS